MIVKTGPANDGRLGFTDYVGNSILPSQLMMENNGDLNARMSIKDLSWFPINLKVRTNCRMNYQHAAACLLPLLIAEALYVRIVTPRLPEPAGDRSGTEGAGPRLRLLILGDSAAAGVGVSAQRQALSGQLVCALGADFRVSWQLMAKTGRKAKDVVSLLKEIPPETFDVAVTSIGVNDVTHGTNASKWIDQQRQIIELLQMKFHSPCILLSSVPPMHLFPALPQPLRWYLGRRAKQFNSELERLAEGDRRCEVIKIDFPLEAAYMAADGFHPGAPAYTLWAQRVADRIRSRLAESRG